MKQTMLKLFKIGMIPLGIIYSLFNKRKGIVILMYHRVNDGVTKELSVTQTDFKWQMDYLKRKGFQVISLDEALRLGHDCQNQTKGKYVVLTFDDGYEDYYTNAYPVLSNLKYQSIVYVVPGYVETNRLFWWDEELGESKLMNWKQITELKNNNLVQFGSHSMNHPDFDKLNKTEVEKELCLSKSDLESRLSTKVKHFAYPRGIVTIETKDAIRKLYESAVSIFDGDELSEGIKKDDLMQLKRLPVQRSDGRLLFGARLKGWLIAEEWVKNMLGRH